MECHVMCCKRTSLLDIVDYGVMKFTYLHQFNPF